MLAVVGETTASASTGGRKEKVQAAASKRGRYLFNCGGTRLDVIDDRTH